MKSDEINQLHQEWTRRVARGEPYNKIAEEAGVSASAVGQTVRRAERILGKEFRCSMARQKIRLTATYQEVIRLAFDAFDRSQQDETVEESGVTASGAINKTRTRTQAGDASFLNAASAANDKIVHLWGFNKAEEDNPDEGFKWAGATEAELLDQEIQRLMRERDAIRIDESATS